jgi:hypothetical protein
MFSTECMTEMRCKYVDGMRKSFGVAMVIPLDSEGNKLPVEGRKAGPFDYSDKILVSLKDWREKVEKEIANVRHLEHGGEWVTSSREPGKLYLDDPLTKIDGIAKVTAKSFTDFGICNIGHLFAITEDKENEIEIVSARNNLSAKRISQFTSNAAALTLPINSPQVKDYRTHQNPYSERYGDEWEAKIAPTQFLSSYICVTELVKHMVKETKRVFKGTKYESNPLFYHDALSLMTAKETTA